MKFVHLTCAFVVTCVFTVNSASAKVWSPYLMGDPNRIEKAEGYCQNSSEEKKLWSAINKFTDSFLRDAPQIPPEQKAYIQGELQSGNAERRNRIFQNPIYKMEKIHSAIGNLNVLSSDYLKYQWALSLEKKMEFIGRSLINIVDDEVDYDQLEKMTTELQSKNYFIPAESLSMYWAVTRSLRSQLVYHLICYGEKYNQKTR